MSDSGEPDLERDAPKEDDLRAAVPSVALRGEEAAAYGRALLMDATSTGNIDDAMRVALGHSGPTSKSIGAHGPHPPYSAAPPDDQEAGADDHHRTTEQRASDDT